MSKNDGGYAFPRKSLMHPDISGMTLRDYFAGQALAGICANSGWNDTFHGSVNDPSAKASYAMADAMIAARDA